MQESSPPCGKVIPGFLLFFFYKSRTKVYKRVESWIVCRRSYSSNYVFIVAPSIDLLVALRETKALVS